MSGSGRGRRGALGVEACPPPVCACVCPPSRSWSCLRSLAALSQVGASDVAALLRSGGLRARLVDSDAGPSFVQPRRQQQQQQQQQPEAYPPPSAGGAHAALLAWVWAYFTGEVDGALLPNGPPAGSSVTHVAHAGPGGPGQMGAGAGGSGAGGCGRGPHPHPQPPPPPQALADAYPPRARPLDLGTSPSEGRVSVSGRLPILFQHQVGG